MRSLRHRHHHLRRRRLGRLGRLGHRHLHAGYDLQDQSFRNCSWTVRASALKSSANIFDIGLFIIDFESQLIEFR